MSTLGRNHLKKIEAWMRRRGVGWICAVSPHLDDAAFSIATLLAHPALPAREVWTVFSSTTADGDMAYAKAMGFDDPLQEFEARRDEDRDAMRMLGVPFRHLGVAATRFDATSAAALVDEVRAGARQHGGRALVLLPAGAGIEPTEARRLWCRVIRRPVGCRPHAEHERVRDVLAAGLASGRAADSGAEADRCLVGFYAEVPYLWSQGPRRLEARLRALVGRRLDGFAVAPRVDFKLEVARAYRSQFVSEFGDQPFFQRRSLSGEEWIYLPA